MLLFDRGGIARDMSPSPTTLQSHRSAGGESGFAFFMDGPSRRIVDPCETARAEELWLLTVFAAELTFRWGAMATNPVEVAMVVAGLMAPLLAWERRRFAEAVDDLIQAGELRRLAGDPEDLPIYLAATRWFCGLALPRTPDELRAGPPLFSRERSGGRRG